jgi:hypothetical protein
MKFANFEFPKAGTRRPENHAPDPHPIDLRNLSARLRGETPPEHGQRR